MSSGATIKIKTTDIPQLSSLMKMHTQILNKKFQEHELLELRKLDPIFALRLHTLMEGCTQQALEFQSAGENSRFVKYFHYTSCLAGTVCPDEFQEWIMCIKKNSGIMGNCTYQQKLTESCAQKYSKDLLKVFNHNLYRKKM